MKCFTPLATSVSAALLLYLSSCGFAERVGTLDESTFSPDIAVPLLSSTVSADQLFDELNNDNRFIRVDQDGLVSIISEDEFYSLNLGDSLALQDLVFPVPASPTTIPLALLGVPAIETGQVKTGNIQFRVEMAVSSTYNLTLTFDNILRNGQPVELTQQFTGASFALPTADAEDIAGTTIDFTSGEISVSYTLTETTTNLPVSPQTLEVTFTELAFSYVQGDFSDAFIIEETVREAADFLSRFDGIDVELEGSSFALIFDNSVGLPLSLRLLDFTATNSRTNETIDVMKSNHPLVSGQTLAYPTLMQVGEFVQDSIAFTDDNANLPELSGLFPDETNFTYDADILPGQGFITDSSVVTLNIRAEVPLSLRLSNVTYQDSFDLEVEWPELEGLEEIELKFLAENGLPLEVICQLYFLDESDQVLDSLLTGSDILLDAAPVDGDGFVTDVVSRELFIPIEAERYLSISNSSRVSVRLGLETSEQGGRIVKFTDTNTLGIKLGARTQFDATLQDIN